MKVVGADQDNGVRGGPGLQLGKEPHHQSAGQKWWVTMPAQIRSPAASLGGGATTVFFMAFR